MRTSLVTREEMIEAIEQHTACISTRDIPGVIANYFIHDHQTTLPEKGQTRSSPHSANRYPRIPARTGSSELRNRRSRSTQGGTQNESK